jgi:hypothetical protein
MRNDMAPPQRVAQAVQAGIVASAHLAALQHVSAAAEACQRLGRLTSGRWRAAARDLSSLEGNLQTALNSALEELEDDDTLAVKVLEGDVLFGTSFIEDPDLPDRGTTLLFGWPDPLEPASWPWQANWVVGDSDSQDDVEAEELDLFENGELEGDDALVAGLADELDSGQEQARAALRNAAMALTRASLLAGTEGDEDEEDDDEDNGTV